MHTDRGDDEYISPIEAARIAGVGKSTIYRAMMSGRLPYTMVMGHYAIRRTDIEGRDIRSKMGRPRKEDADPDDPDPPK